MSLSVITYAVFTGMCGLASNAEQIAIYRFIASLGLGGEWSLGVALVMEVWPNKSRALMAGLIGAAANVGYLLVGAIGLVLNSFLSTLQEWMPTVGFSQEWTTYLTQFSGWRIMMLLGTLPALLTFLFRLFVPESEKWQEHKDRGTTSHWQTRDLLGVLVGAIGAFMIVVVWSPQFAQLNIPGQLPLRMFVTVIGLAIATAGYLYPVVQFLKRSETHQFIQDPLNDSQKSIAPIIRLMLMGACLSGVALLGTWGSTQWVPTWAGQMVNAGKIADGWTEAAKHAKEYSQMSTAMGAVVGTIIAALCGDWLGRRMTYFLFCIAGSLSVMYLFLANDQFGGQLLVSAFVAGVLTASFYGWLPLYLPELFGTRFRATGQGFAFNFGRIIAAIGSLQAGVLAKAPGVNLMGLEIPSGYPLACSTMSLIYVVGMVLIWRMPETKGQPLPE